MHTSLLPQSTEREEENGEEEEEGSGHSVSAGGGDDGVSGPQRNEHMSLQFSFEDGTPLCDYPASVDIELSENGSDSHTESSKDMTIYSSQILQTVPTSEATASSVGNGDKRLKPVPAHTSTELTRPSSLSYSRASETEGQSGTTAPPPELVMRDTTSGRVHTPYPKLGMSETAVAEAQQVLDKSLTDLLEITETLDEVPSDHECSTEQIM